MEFSQLVDVIELKALSETDEPILRFETLISARLPEAYRQFLLICNGGQIGKDLLGSLWLDDGRLDVPENRIC